MRRHRRFSRGGSIAVCRCAPTGHLAVHLGKATACLIVFLPLAASRARLGDLSVHGRFHHRKREGYMFVWEQEYFQSVQNGVRWWPVEAGVARFADRHAVSRSLVDRFQALKVFVTVAENGGFSSAAKRLGISASAATKAVARLEDGLDVQLFRRSTRHVALTGAGRVLFEHSAKVLEALGDAEAAVRKTRASSGGNVPRGDALFLRPRDICTGTAAICRPPPGHHPRSLFQRRFRQIWLQKGSTLPSCRASSTIRRSFVAC